MPMIKLILRLMFVSLLAWCAAPATGWTQGATIPIEVEGTESVVDTEEVDLAIFQGQLYLEEGDLLNAVSEFARAVTLDPERMDAHLYLARSLTSALLEGKIQDVSGASAEAMRHYQWVLDRDPNHREAAQGMKVITDRFFEGIAVPLETSKGRRGWEAGTRAVDKGDYKAAAKAFGQAAEAEPDVPEVQRALATALLLDGRTTEAKVAYERTLELKPNDPAAHAGYGRCIEIEGDSTAALEHYREALLGDDTNIPSAEGIVRILGTADRATLDNDDLALLGRAYLATGQIDEAVAALEEAAADRPTVENRKALGIAQFFRERDTDAAIILTGVYEETPNDGEVLYYLAASLMRSGRMDEGQQYLRDALIVNPADPSALRLLGLILADQPGQETEAIELLNRARRAGGYIPELPCILGTLEMRLGHDDAAWNAFSECVETSPDHPEATLGLGILSDRRGQKGRAIVQYEKYLKLADADPGVLFRLAVAYLRVGQDESGFDTLRRIVAVDTTLALGDSTEVTETQLLEMTTFFLATIRRYEDAIFIGEMLLTRDPDNAIYNNNLAMSYADAGENPKRAHQLAVKATQLQPDQAGHLDTLGWTLLRLKRYEEAEQTLLRALELAQTEGRTDLSEILYHIGYLYRVMGRHDEAQDYLTRALENPPTPFLRAEIERLLNLDQVEEPED
jgi:tetratricopeptide (TPR) repeat protein